MKTLKTLYKGTLLSAYVVLKNNILSQKNTRVPEPDEVMEDLDGVQEYLHAMDSDYSGVYNLILSKLTSILPLEGKALDLGCGPAILTTKLAKAFPKIEWLGVDASDAMLALAEKRVYERDIANVHFKKLDYRALDSLDEKFDFICISLMLHHVRAEADAVELINLSVRRLKPGGALLIFDFVRPRTDKIALQITDIYTRPLGEIVYQDSLASLRAAFSFEEVERILERSNFENYEHARDILNVYQFVCTKAPRRRRFLPQAKKPLEWAAYYWHKFLFLGRM